MTDDKSLTNITLFQPPTIILIRFPLKTLSKPYENLNLHALVVQFHIGGFNLINRTKLPIQRIGSGGCLQHVIFTQF